MTTFSRKALVCLLALAASSAVAQPPTEPQPPDHGRVLGTHVDVAPGLLKDTTKLADTKNYVYRGRIISLGADRSVGLCFDTDQMRVAGAWVGKPVTYVAARNMGPKIDAVMLFATQPGPGWAKDGRWDDPRDPQEGPLPRDWAHYKGIALHGDRAILRYTVGDSSILEMPETETIDGVLAVTRTFDVGPSARKQSLLVCEHAGANAEILAASGDRPTAALNAGKDRVFAGVVGAPAGTTFEAAGSRLILHLPASSKPAAFRLVLTKTSAEANEKVLDPFRKRPVEDLRPLLNGGPPRWKATIETKAVAAPDSGGPYVVDRIGIPEANPWRASVRFTGLDFFPDGRAALCTWDGDVWVASGLGPKLETVRWQRFASGLQQTVGLKIIRGVIHTAGRDQITRLHDLNGDGEADFYENFNNDAALTLQRHEYVMDLQTDAAGNLYYARSGHYIASKKGDNCVIYKLSPDGLKLEVFARGFREPNGFSIGPDGTMTVGDNEGNTIPQSPLYRLKQGAFYGYAPASGGKASGWTSSEPALIWFPKNVDRSPGSQVWVPEKSWGPFQGGLLHTSYGSCALFAVLIDKNDEPWQAAAWKFPLTFESGIMRPRFNPADGQLYVAGLRGYDTAATRDGQFARVRFTSESTPVPLGFRVVKGGLQVTFSGPLDKAAAEDDQNWAFDCTGPFAKQGTKILGKIERTIESVRLSADGRTATIQIEVLAPAMNFNLIYRLKNPTNVPARGTLHGTIHRIPTT